MSSEPKSALVDTDSQVISGEQKIPMQAWLLLVLLTFAWGSMWPFLKLALAEIPLMTLRSGAASTAGILMLAVAAIAGRALRPVSGEVAKLFLVSVFGVFFWFYLSGLAVNHLPAGRAALLAYTMPFFSLIISLFFLKEKVSPKRFLGVFAGLAAILVLSWDDVMQTGAAGFPIGIIAILGAAITWSIGSTLQRNFFFQTPVSVLTGWLLLMGGVPLGVIAIGIDTFDWIYTLSPQAALAALSVTVVSTACGTWCWSGLLKLTDMGFASIAVLSVPVMSQILSLIVLGEEFDLTKAIGMGLIIFGLSTILPFKGLLHRIIR